MGLTPGLGPGARLQSSSQLNSDPKGLSHGDREVTDGDAMVTGRDSSWI